MAKRVFIIKDEEVANAIEVLLEAKEKAVRRSLDYNPQGTMLDRGYSHRNSNNVYSYSGCGLPSSFGMCGGGSIVGGCGPRLGWYSGHC